MAVGIAAEPPYLWEALDNRVCVVKFVEPEGGSTSYAVEEDVDGGDGCDRLECMYGGSSEGCTYVAESAVLDNG